MRIGIGLPITTTEANGRRLLDWAGRAEERGFDSLTAIDRIVYPSFEPMAALAGAAAVTSRVLLRTNVLLGPTRNPVLLAKQAATLDQLSGGRFVLGLGVGRRPDDYEATGTSFRDRGRRLDAALEQMAAAWTRAGEHPPTPPTTHAGGVPMVFGGALPIALPRILAHGQGWTVAIRPAEEVAPLVGELRAAWHEAGREGVPEVIVMHYFALGEGSSVEHLLEYYGYQGDRSYAIADGATRTATQAAETVAAYREAGVDEFVFVPTMADLAQVELLGDAVLP
jgi:alkanesulfonate monooxygenase SsuD/methylene tetrahydromethanopterin reductase-like flavin-dependent oxidoreductase (luciferase family)